MPRPVRSRVAPAAPKGNAAGAAPAAEPEPAKKAAASQVTQVEAVSDTSSDIYGLSDREIERQAIRRASGGTAHAKPQQAKALEESRTRRDAAMNVLDDLSSTSPLEGPSTARKASSTTVRASRRSSSRLRRSAPDASGLEVMDDSELFGGNFDDLDMDISLGEDSVLAGGQRSTDTSSFNVGLFRRGRPRQSSIVGRDDAPIRPSSRGPNTPSISTTFNIGTFKRRAREQSILGSRRKARQEPDETEPPADEERPGDSDIGSDEEVIPESVIGSPSRRRTRGSDIRDREPSLPAVDTSPEEGSSRKRKSTEGQDGSSKRPARESIDVPQDSIESDSELSLPPLDDTPSTPGHDTARRAVVDEDDDILAPPASSSSSDASPISWPSLRNLPRNRHRRALSDSRKTPAPAHGEDVLSDMSSPPSLTHSPNYAAAKTKNTRGAATAKNARKASPKLTTAELTAMLPKRRQRTARDDQSDGEFDSTTVANEADELSYVEGSRARRARRPAGPLAGPNAPVARAQATKGHKRRARRTYGSRATAGSDKENQDGEGEGDTIQVAADEEYCSEDALADDTLDATEGHVELPGKLSEELQQAAQKFKEVDRWEMEFEEVTESSSPEAAAAR
ncbi:hypothetical protein PpBr36_08692 [Pyricularia pennisetigena]|uniref:hypothetical protein n=1 Tax=Pyricularia pennisetigena TaxID=1578925 RepID=UPI0011517627|nr:hypothetical protein PpBr36_08692 [Pyricularia pennisetigena]TLS24130.1 hypothetical protein PpBr36_08692 [Pyricularia pennisetigena]